MPKIRNNSCSRTKKEKQTLTARLIEISLKIEDYIYKHKLISECEAEQYIREVTSYKSQCGRDERSLQVIEKLTRCMKAIIVDHQETRNYINNKNDGGPSPNQDVRAESVSPVYSISEEDRTVLTQIPKESARSIPEANKDVEIIDVCNTDDEESIHNEMTSSASAEYASSKINVVVDIHRAISNLSLREVEDPLEISSSNAIFSQSILNNFESIEKMQQNEINVKPQGASRLMRNVADKVKTTNFWKVDSMSPNITNTDKPQGKLQNNEPALPIKPHKILKSKVDIPVIKTINNKCNLKGKTVSQNKKPMKIKNTTYYRETNLSNQIDNTNTSNMLHTASNKIPETEHTWYDSNRTFTINTSNNILKEAIHSIQSVLHNKVVNSNPNTANNSANCNVNIPTNNLQNGRHTITSNETSRAKLNNDEPVNNVTNVDENSTTTKKKRGPLKKKIIDKKEIKPKSKRTGRTPKRLNQTTLTNMVQKDKNIPIYNNKVENDLSWIENIRYVREIKEDENDSNLNLEESFWHDFYLPDNWNDTDFL